MKKNKQKAPDFKSGLSNEFNIIISGKKYSVNELNAIFSYNSLKLCDDKETLLKYWYLAVESGVKKFINTVDRVFIENFPKYE